MARLIPDLQIERGLDSQTTADEAPRPFLMLSTIAGQALHIRLHPCFYPTRSCSDSGSFCVISLQAAQLYSYRQE